MARKDHSRQYSFRVNLDNPEHLRVYRTLEDLNTNIHKSISSFVIKAVLSYIKSADEAELTNAGKDRKDRLQAEDTTVLNARQKASVEVRILVDLVVIICKSVFILRCCFPRRMYASSRSITVLTARTLLTMTLLLF